MCIGDGTAVSEAEVYVEGGVIVDVSSEKRPSDVMIDASELIVAPGFIDAHTHSDFNLMVDPFAESSIRQGVTTEVIGNCGDSLAPLSRTTRERLKARQSGYSEYKVTIDWSTFGEYLSRYDARGIAQNIIPLVGHGTIREMVLGFDMRMPSAGEIEKMKALVRQSMTEGAHGLSSGLEYAPGAFAEPDELVELCKVVADLGGLYATHVRSCMRGEEVDAVREAIEIAKRSGVSLQVSHIDMANAADEVLPIIDKARLAGLDVTFDQHPYLWAYTTLTTLLPRWALEGGSKALLRRLGNRKTRGMIKKGMRERLGRLEGGSLDSIRLAASDASHLDPTLIGKTFARIGKMKGIKPEDAVLEILIEGKGDADLLQRIYRENDKIKYLKHGSMIMSDGVVHVGPCGGGVHRRDFGTFPHAIEKYVTRKRIIGLEDMIRRITYLPAKRFKLRNRGLLKKGFQADIVMFALDKLKDRSTYESACRYPDGVEYVIVNGTIVIDRGRVTGELPGEVVRFSPAEHHYAA